MTDTLPQPKVTDPILHEPKPLQPKFPKLPKIPRLPKVTGLVGAGFLIAQYLLFAGSDVSESVCHLKVNYPHYSTSIYKGSGGDAVKVNTDSICTEIQLYTQISMVIQVHDSFSKKQNNAFDGLIKTPDETGKVAKFRSQFVPCIYGTISKYRAVAKGIVHLASGSQISVSDDSGKFTPVKCEKSG